MKDFSKNIRVLLYQQLDPTAIAESIYLLPYGMSKHIYVPNTTGEDWLTELTNLSINSKRNYR